MGRHELPSEGAWVELRDWTDIRAQDRKTVRRAMAGAVRLDDEGNVLPSTAQDMLATAEDVGEAVAAMVITAWCIPYLPEPTVIPLAAPDAGLIVKLTCDDYDALLELAAPAVKAFTAGRAITPDDHADPASPSEPASG